MSKIVLGVSSCLLGKKVRYSGDAKKDSYIHDILNTHFKLVPICPEVGIGLPTPRKPIRLVSKNGQEIAITIERPDEDHTEALTKYADRVAPVVESFSGYIFKSRSPSCGVYDTKVYKEDGARLHNKGQGIYVKALLEKFPLLPVEEEGRLNDARLREAFFARVFVYHEWRQVEENLTRKGLIQFHSKVKYLLLAYHPRLYRLLGKMLSDLSKKFNQIKRRYIKLVMHALKKPTTRGKHTNVLMHLLGYFKKCLDTDQKQYVLAKIRAYHLGQIPLISVIQLYEYLLINLPNPYLKQQFYLSLFPDNLQAQNLMTRL